MSNRALEIYKKLKNLKSEIIKAIEERYDQSDLHNAINDYINTYEDLFDEVQIPMCLWSYVKEMEETAEILFCDLNSQLLDLEDDEDMNTNDVDILKDTFEELENWIWRIVG